MPQRILVLGASGYIGQHLTTALSQRGHQVLAAARNTDRLQKLALPGVTCHNVDLNWPKALPALLEEVDTLYSWSTAWAKAAILSPTSDRWR